MRYFFSANMHRCLRVNDILLSIVQHVPEGEGLGYDSEVNYASYEAEKPRTLAAFARTCRVFYSVATPRLWAVQDSLDNLMGCLPMSSWTRDKDGSMVRLLLL